MGLQVFCLSKYGQFSKVIVSINISNINVLKGPAVPYPHQYRLLPTFSTLVF